jgi:hypothetical protein
MTGRGQLVHDGKCERKVDRSIETFEGHRIGWRDASIDSIE